MRYFSTKDIGRIFVLRLDPGDYVLESIMDLVEKEGVKEGVVVSAVGTLDRYSAHMVTSTTFPPENLFVTLNDEPMEVLSICGLIVAGEPHLHIVVSDSKKAYGGHLEKGCRTLYVAEIVIIELKSLNLKRVRESDQVKRLTNIEDNK
ncbi:MAG: DNA-binding protein [Nitrososphaerota archaeon]|nr:DNA-binding protein [Candidatus Bathyarchaeota archaeon]MDW8048248.1 DNA-binding protein [Nitrososphaerota archaeon]